MGCLPDTPGSSGTCMQEDGRLRSFVNLYLNETDIRHLASTQTPVRSGDVLTIVPSIAGGSPGGSRNETAALSHAEMLRYSRHLLLPEVGVAGQRKLKAARVLTVGAGGLGLATVALSCRGRGRDDRHRGLRRCGSDQSPAPDRARNVYAGPAQARFRRRAAHRSQSERQDRAARDAG